MDLVIHTAGPFQRTDNHSVLEAAIKGKVAYIDVSDDLEYSERWGGGGMVVLWLRRWCGGSNGCSNGCGSGEGVL